MHHSTVSHEKFHLPRILIVDDDDLIRDLHELVLNRAGYETQVAVDGEEALRVLAAEAFDLVLTDGKMPRLDGCGLVRALRRGGSCIPVMMVSGSIDGKSDLPPDVRDEFVVALPKWVKTTELLAGIALALHSRPAFRGKARLGPDSPSEVLAAA